MIDDTEEHLFCDSADETTSLTSQDTLKDTSAEVVLFRLDEADEACRVCLKTGTIPIFSSEDLSEDLNHFTGIDVKPDDCLPRNLCCFCRKSLDTAITLRKLAQESDCILRKQLGEQFFNIEERPLFLPDKIYDENTTESKYADGQTSDGGSVYLEYGENDDSDDIISENNMLETLSNPEANEPDDEDQPLAANPSKNKFPKCEVCEITFRTIEQVEDHGPNHKDVIVCEVCKNIVPNSAYQKHINAHKIYYKQKLQRKSLRVECAICNKLIRERYLKQHMSMHDSRDTATCSICEKTLKKKYLNAHMLRMHSKKTRDSEPGHIKTVGCPVCSRRVTEANYDAHVASHRAKIYVCEECGKELSNHGSYVTHLLTHKEVYNFKCDLCPYRGKHKGLLRTHMRTHTNDYSYKCDTCDACFLTKSNLTSHKKTHSVSQFLCSQCGKSFAREKTLHFHKICIHDGIKTFRCDLCPKMYGKKDVLVAHKRRVHKVDNRSVLVDTGGSKNLIYLESLKY